MTSHSQNGYTSRDSSVIASYTIVRDVKISLRKGDASVVLLHFARWYDKNIEPLTKADTGGYNPRHIEGSNVDSNHASGTAEDLRWQKHARGKKNTFTQSQKDKIHAQLKFYEGVIRWGEDYKDAPTDGMHYEVNRGPKELARIAKKVKASTNPVSPKPPAPKPPVHPHVAVDGKLGAATIRLWQRIMKTKVTGEIDSDNSQLIRAVQTRLRVTDHTLKVDGDLGKHTIRRLQSYLKTPVDGILGTQTVKALQRRLNTGRF